MKQVPRFWWDFEWKDRHLDAIIVETDHPKYPQIIARFHFKDSAVQAIEKAWKLIDDLNAGRKTIKKNATVLEE